MKVFLFKKSFFIYATVFFIAISICTFSIFFLINSNITNSKTITRKTPNNIKIYEDEKNEYDTFQKKLTEKYKDKKLIALTFDDGPSKYTDILVDELKKRNIPATFFILGINVKGYENTLKNTFDAGNEIGVHSYVHKLFTRLKDDEILEQIEKTKIIIHESTGLSPTLIRVPYGSLSNRVEMVLEQVELKSITWNVDSLDWKFKNTDKVFNYVIKKVKGNDIILMHDTYISSINAALKIIDELTKRGYTFVTVSEFLKTKELSQKNQNITNL
ncbi:MAG: polysaccharide deacetylase family protein [Clostridia bacterium]